MFFSSDGKKENMNDFPKYVYNFLAKNNPILTCLFSCFDNAIPTCTFFFNNNMKTIG